MELSASQIVYIVLAALVVAVIIFLAIFFPTRSHLHKTHYHYFYYRLIYKIALLNDYYLINNFQFIASNGDLKTIDHILFANKYIYLIGDYSYNGDLDGTSKDLSLILYNKDGRSYIDNPLLTINTTIREASNITGLDTSLLIGIVLINDDCKCGVTSESKSTYIVQRKKLKKLIKVIEAWDVAELNPDELASAVATLDKINMKKGDKKNA